MYIFGLIGAVLICLAYFLLQKGFFKPHSYTYLSLNSAGSVCLIVSLAFPFQMGNLGAIIVQCVMIGISIYGFTKASSVK